LNWLFNVLSFMWLNLNNFGRKLIYILSCIYFHLSSVTFAQVCHQKWQSKTFFFKQIILHLSEESFFALWNAYVFCHTEVFSKKMLQQSLKRVDQDKLCWWWPAFVKIREGFLNNMYTIFLTFNLISKLLKWNFNLFFCNVVNKY